LGGERDPPNLIALPPICASYPEGDRRVRGEEEREGIPSLRDVKKKKGRGGRGGRGRGHCFLSLDIAGRKDAKGKKKERGRSFIKPLKMY